MKRNVVASICPIVWKIDGIHGDVKLAPRNQNNWIQIVNNVIEETEIIEVYVRELNFIIEKENCIGVLKECWIAYGDVRQGNIARIAWN